MPIAILSCINVNAGIVFSIGSGVPDTYGQFGVLILIQHSDMIAPCYASAIHHMQLLPRRNTRTYMSVTS